MRFSSVNVKFILYFSYCKKFLVVISVFTSDIFIWVDKQNLRAFSQNFLVSKYFMLIFDDLTHLVIKETVQILGLLIWLYYQWLVIEKVVFIKFLVCAISNFLHFFKRDFTHYSVTWTSFTFILTITYKISLDIVHPFISLSVEVFLMNKRWLNLN